MPLRIAQCSNVSQSLCKASCPLRESTAPPNLVSSASLLMVHSISASRLLIKILNRTDPRIEPWGMLLVTGYWPDVIPLTTTLWALALQPVLHPAHGHLTAGLLQKDTVTQKPYWNSENLHPPPLLHLLGSWPYCRRRWDYTELSLCEPVLIVPDDCIVLWTSFHSTQYNLLHNFSRYWDKQLDKCTLVAYEYLREDFCCFKRISTPTTP